MNRFEANPKNRWWLSALVLAFALTSLAQARDPESTLAPASAAGAGRSAQALNIAFADESFSYYELEQGVVQLAFADGTLTLELVEVANPHGVTHKFAEVPELSRESFNAIYREPDHSMSWMAKRKAQAEERERLQEWVNVERHDGGLTVRHEDADFEATMSYYLGTLESFGFAVALEQRYPSVRVYQVDNGQQQARLVFTRSGNDVRVRLTGTAL